MSNNISIRDKDAATRVMKTTDTAGVHTPHHNIDNLSEVTSKLPSVLDGDRLKVILPVGVSGLTDTELRATPVPVSGTVTTGGLTDAQIRATPLPVSGTVNTGLSQPLTDTQLRLTPVPVSGTVSTGGLTDTQIRATPLPVSGTISTGLSQPLTDAQLRAVAVPVSASSLPLPTGAATSAKQDTTITSLGTDITSPTAMPTGGVGIRGWLSAIWTKLNGTVGVTGTFWQATQPVSGTFFQATQPISAVTLPLPSGAATAANQQTNALTDTQLRATPLPVSGTVAVTGTFWQATQPVSGTFFQATQPVSAASLPLPAGAATEASIGTDITTPTAMPTGGVGLRGWISAIWTKLNGTIGVTGTFWQATQPVSGTFWQATQPVSAATLPLPSGAATEATLAGIAADLPASLGAKTGANSFSVVPNSDTAFPVSDNAGSLTVDAPVATPVFVRLSDGAAPIATLPVSGTFFQTTQPVSAASLPLPAGAATAANQQTNALTDAQLRATAVPVSAPTLTKGTQGANGLTTQDLKDAGRVNLVFRATAVASGTTTTETAIPLSKNADTGAASSASSFVITSGKRFRITSVTFATRGNVTATAQVTTFSIRINTAGAVTTTSTPIVFQARCATPATANEWDRFQLPIPDGMEFVGDGTIQFGITANAVFVTNAPTWDVLITGFEY